MFIPDPIFFIPDPGSASKNLSIFNPKTETKFSKIRSGMFIPNPGYRILALDFFPSRIPDPDPGVKKALDPDPQHCFEGCQIISSVGPAFILVIGRYLAKSTA
jgi:hypothetical protein